jgi:hypothetical protein
MKEIRPEQASKYDVDYYRWTQETAEHVRRGRFDEIDRNALAEEIADMGKRDQREVRSRTIVLIAHLLKWKLQRNRRGDSWLNTIDEQRGQLRLLFEDSPSLAHLLDHELPLLYMRATRRVLRDTGIDPPPACPFATSEILDESYLPD